MASPTTRSPLPIRVGDAVAATGPLVVPSYSSKALARISVSTAVENTAEFIAGSVLISAYDIKHHGVDPGRFKVQLIIVDSGGYENSRRRGGQASGRQHRPRFIPVDTGSPQRDAGKDQRCQPGRRSQLRPG